MTEAKWLACADPMPMLEFLQGKASERKLRLFVGAANRQIPAPAAGAVSKKKGGGWEPARLLRRGRVQRLRGLRCPVLRDIFGNPFRPISLSTAWQTPTVVLLA